MNILSVDLEYCFGIGKFKYDFEFSEKKSNTFLIYAPNGTMKTSFAKTFDLIAKNEAKNMPMDKVYTERQSKYDILVDGNSILPESILVVNAENDTFDASSKLSSFIASKDLKERYDSIYKELDLQKTDFIRKLKAVSQSYDCEGEVVDTFLENEKNSFLDILTNLFDSLSDKFDKYEFKYNSIFDKSGKVEKFIEKNKDVLDQYMNDYIDLLSNSKFFKNVGDKSFGTHQANELMKSIEDNSFFEAGHKFVLEDGTEIKDSEDLKAVVQAEIDSIVNDIKLKASFDRVDKALRGNVDMRDFKQVIEKNNLLLVELKDYDGFKRKVWLGFLSALRDDAKSLVDFYLSKKAELEQIIKEAKKEAELWKQIVETFNTRFFVPFTVDIGNQEDVILKEETANLIFHYSDGEEEPVSKGKQDLLDVLSRGEKRAYFILQFLFEIESRKNSPLDQLIIFDDVADSFDYKNKYAIIEYIRDLRESDKFKIILLTHNFDFYRTVTGRLHLYRPSPTFFLATKSNSKEILLSEGFDSRNVFADFLKDIEEPKAFISCIPFVRNIIEFVDVKKCDDYQKLTSSLHLKADSTSIKAIDLFDIYKTRLSGLEEKNITFAEMNIIELIENTASEIVSDEEIDEVSLYNKIVLSIAIRISAERYLTGELADIIKNWDHPNPTIYLYDKYREVNPKCQHLDLLSKVNLMTPENIHINAFMYEPLVDMSIYHLRSLYEEIRFLS